MGYLNCNASLICKIFFVFFANTRDIPTRQIWCVSRLSPGLKKNIVCFRFPTDPIKTCATQIFLWISKKKKKKIFFFFLGNQ